MCVFSESLMRGWELLSICLLFFAPSFRFHACLDGYIARSLERSFHQVSFSAFVLSATFDQFLSVVDGQLMSVIIHA